MSNIPKHTEIPKGVYIIGGHRNRPWPSLIDYFNNRMKSVVIEQPPAVDWSKIGMTVEEAKQSMIAFGKSMNEAGKAFKKMYEQMPQPQIIISDPGDEQESITI